jgi:NAD(P)-dependent dehydrogenase (short-subunit alcohol dehydrogenase family)
MPKLTEKVALVTGGSRGIGAAIAKRLAADGANVAITYTKGADAAVSVVKEIERAGRKAIAIRADAADADAVEAAVEKTVATFGRLDVLVNNAGTAVPKRFEETTLEEMDRLIGVNIRGVFVATQAALKHMKSGGRIISIGSAVGERALTPGLCPTQLQRERLRCSLRACPEKWRAGASQSTTCSRVRSIRMRIQPRASGRYRRRPSQHSTAMGTLMRSPRWWRLSPVRSPRTLPGRILPWMAG